MSRRLRGCRQGLALESGDGIGGHFPRELPIQRSQIEAPARPETASRWCACQGSGCGARGRSQRPGPRRGACLRQGSRQPARQRMYAHLLGGASAGVGCWQRRCSSGRRRRDGRARHGRLSVRYPGNRDAGQADCGSLSGRPRERCPLPSRRQRHHLRYRRPQPQERCVHGRHEVRHVRCCLRARRCQGRHCRQAALELGRHRRGCGKHAEWRCHATERHRFHDVETDRGNNEYRCGRAPGVV